MDKTVAGELDKASTACNYVCMCVCNVYISSADAHNKNKQNTN